MRACAADPAQQAAIHGYAQRPANPPGQQVRLVEVPPKLPCPVKRNRDDEIGFLDLHLFKLAHQFRAEYVAAGHVRREFESADQLVDGKAVRQARDGLAPRGWFPDAWPTKKFVCGGDRQGAITADRAAPRQFVTAGGAEVCRMAGEPAKQAAPWQQCIAKDPGEPREQRPPLD